MSATILAATARILHRLLAQNDIAPDSLFLACGLDPLKLRDARARYPIDNFRTAWQLADEQIQRPCWALQAGEVWNPTDCPVLTYAFQASPTLRTALARLRRYYSVVRQDIRIEIRESDAALLLSYHIATAKDLPAREEARVAVLRRMCQDAYGPDLRLQEIAFTHPSMPCSYERFFQCAVRHGAPGNTVTFAPTVVDRYLPAQSHERARQLDEIVHGFIAALTDASVTDRVRQAIVHELPSGKPGMPQVAKALALSHRTLYRKLEEEGTNFEAVIEQVRRELAPHYIRSGYDLLEVTYLMGFANLPAFSRAYKGWTGRTPREDRPNA